MFRVFAGVSMREQWRPILGFKNYEVSNHGRVRSVETGALRKLQTSPKGYKCVTLYRENRKRTEAGHGKGRRVHRLVARAFIGRRPSKRHNVAHLDGVRSNNRVDNLQWCDYEENEHHKIEHGTYFNRGFNSTGNRITVELPMIFGAVFYG